MANEIELPGLIPGAPERAPQVTIRCGEVPDSLAQPSCSGPTWQMAGKQFLLRIPNIARFLVRVRASLEKFYVDAHDAFSEPPTLGAIYALREARPPHKPGIERPNVVDAALVLRGNAYRPLVVRRMNQKANYFRAAATIANAAGIFHLTRALDFARLPEVIAWLEAHWRDLRPRCRSAAATATRSRSRPQRCVSS